jgi:hypothetical protein
MRWWSFRGVVCEAHLQIRGKITVSTENFPVSLNPIIGEFVGLAIHSSLFEYPLIALLLIE